MSRDSPDPYSAAYMTEMDFTAERTIGDIAAEIPATIRVLERFRVAYCCGSNMPLEEVCASAGMTFDDFMAAVRSAVVPPEIGLDWAGAPLYELQSYLVQRFHQHAREELDTISILVEKVFAAHGERHLELGRVARLVTAIRQDILPHMIKEEMVLFPYVDQLEHSAQHSPWRFGSIASPIGAMMMEHEAVGDLLRDLRATTAGYTPPPGACFSFRELYRRLAAFERETHEHIRVEDEFYFPGALALEQRVL